MDRGLPCLANRPPTGWASCGHQTYRSDLTDVPDQTTQSFTVDHVGVDFSRLEMLQNPLAITPTWLSIPGIAVDLPVQLAHLTTGARHVILALRGVGQTVGVT